MTNSSLMLSLNIKYENQRQKHKFKQNFIMIKYENINIKRTKKVMMQNHILDW
jgi:hypothetical protein